MHYSQTMRVTERIRHLAYVVVNRIEIDLPSLASHLIDAFPQRAATNIRHHQVSQLLPIYHSLLVFIDGQNILMLQLSNRICLAAKAR